MKRLIWKLALRLAPSVFSTLKEHELKARSEWLLKTNASEGYKTYYQTRYHGILQVLASGIERDNEYYVNLGRRLELLHLLGEAKQEFDRSEKESKKK